MLTVCGAGLGMAQQSVLTVRLRKRTFIACLVGERRPHGTTDRRHADGGRRRRLPVLLAGVRPERKGYGIGTGQPAGRLRQGGDRVHLRRTPAAGDTHAHRKRKDDPDGSVRLHL